MTECMKEKLAAYTAATVERVRLAVGNGIMARHIAQAAGVSEYKMMVATRANPVAYKGNGRVRKARMSKLELDAINETLNGIADAITTPAADGAAIEKGTISNAEAE